MDTIRLPIGVNNYRGDFPYFSKPKTIGEYTVNRTREMHLGRSLAKYFDPRCLGHAKMDLNKGYEQFEEKEGDERIDMLLEWIITMDPKGQHMKKVLHEADIVCWRGLLTKIACTPFCTNDTWKFNAIREGNIIFLCEEKTAENLRREAEMSKRDKLMTYWGHKFEQYITLPPNSSVPCTSEPVSCREEFGVISRTTLQLKNEPPIRLVYGAEVDAIDPDGNYVEIKTQRHALEGGFWRQKSLKWWIQSFLVGIDDLIVGFRDDDGCVHKVDSVRVDTLPRNGRWDSAVCLNFLASVIKTVKQLLNEHKMKCEVTFDLHHVSIKKIPSSEPDFLSKNFKIHYGQE